jgi:uncharacterized membrane protein YccC
MSKTTNPGACWPDRLWSTSAARRGWQLVATVVLAYALSMALRLPGGWWAVMSALIVVRPGTGSTLDAGWNRVRGAALGSAAALVGVGLQSRGFDTVLITLVLVGALSFWSAAAPGLRSAPITALIVVQAVATARHSAWQVAVLRIVEIGVGTLAGVLVTLPLRRRRASERFDARCAELLRQWAEEFPTTLAIPRPAQASADASRWRTALYELNLLARTADGEGQWLRTLRRVGPQSSRETAARLLSRTFNDLSGLVRLVGLLPEGSAAPIAETLQLPVVGALQGTADALTRQGGADLAALRKLASARRADSAEDSSTSASVRWVASGVALLVQDLAAIVHWQGALASPSP